MKVYWLQLTYPSTTVNCGHFRFMRTAQLMKKRLEADKCYQGSTSFTIQNRNVSLKEWMGIYDKD